MRLTRRTTPFALLCATTVFVSCAPRQAPPPEAPRPAGQQATHRVNLAVTCSGDSVSFTLSPWYLRVNRGDVVEWQMTAAPGQVSAFRIEPTPRGRWPWRNTGRIPGRPQRPAISPGIDAKAPGAYRYQVAFECVDERAQRRHNVVVDPDVWLD